MRRNEPTRIFPRPYFNPQIAEHNSPATRAPRPSYTTLRNCSFLIFNPPDAIYCSTRKKVILLYRNNLGLVILIFFNILNGNTIHKKFVTGIPQLTRFLWQPKISVKWNSRYVNHSIAEKNFIENSHNADILYYKTALCKSFCTASKIRVKWNRVCRGIPYTF